MTRKITFANVGIVQRSRVWLNSETGVEITKGANFPEVGLYYVSIPTPDGRFVVTATRTLADARGWATEQVEQMRELIAKAYDDAHAARIPDVDFEDPATGVRILHLADGTWQVTRPTIEGTYAYAPVATADGAAAMAERTVTFMRIRLKNAHLHAIEENFARFAAGAPACSADCGYPGRDAAHALTCPRRAYSVAGPWSQWSRAIRYITAAHAAALVEDACRMKVATVVRAYRSNP